MISIGQEWLQSRRFACIEGIDLLPRENNILANFPLVVSRGQAEAYFLSDSLSRPFILKKFLPGKAPDILYTNSIRSLVPQTPGFDSGFQRRILNSNSVSRAGYYSTEFASWINGAILMPQISGCDWSFLADQVRSGALILKKEQRLSLCRNLSEKARLLESKNIAHRDLSSTNVFIDTKTWDVHLIDWDSTYHATLLMPINTTVGTNGYAAPLIRRAGVEDVKVTWTPLGDRFSLAVLNIEFLSIEKGSPLTGDGGMFDQDELYARGGPGINRILNSLQRDHANAVRLFMRALKACDFNECPGPDEWLSVSLGLQFKAPPLDEIYDPQKDFERFIHKLQAPPQPQLKSPLLSEIEAPDWGQSRVGQGLRPAPGAPRLVDVEDPKQELGRLLGRKP